MLAVILALTVGLASLVFFFSAFFAPKLHRKDDFLWSGVGFFYALVLWICSQRLTGGVLLGQGAATVLILTFAWQTLKLRAVVANAENLPELNSFSLLDWLSGGRRKAKTVKSQATPQSPAPAPEQEPTVEPEATGETGPPAIVLTETVEEAIDIGGEIAEVSTASPEPATISESLPETPSDTEETGISPATELELIESEGSSSVPDIPVPSPSPQPSKPGFFSRLFGRRSTPPPTIREALERVAQEDGDLDDLELEDDLELAVDAVSGESNENEPETPVVTEVETVAQVETLNQDPRVQIDPEEAVAAEISEPLDDTEMPEPVETWTPTPVLADEGGLSLDAGDNDDNTRVSEPTGPETIAETSLLEDLDDFLEDDVVEPDLDTLLEGPSDGVVTASPDSPAPESQQTDAEAPGPDTTDTIDTAL